MESKVTSASRPAAVEDIALGVFVIRIPPRAGFCCRNVFAVASRPASSCEACRCWTLCNLPLGATEQQVRTVLARLGCPAIKCVLCPSRRTAVVEFSEPLAGASSLSVSKSAIKGVYWSTSGLDDSLSANSDGKPETRYARLARLARPPQEDVEKRAVAVIARYEERIRVRKEKRKMPQKRVIDADGFILVKAKRGAPPIRNGAALVEEQEKRMRVENFYRFQAKDKQLDQLRELREKFEKDKQKLEEMRKSRQFKPY